MATGDTTPAPYQHPMYSKLKSLTLDERRQLCANICDDIRDGDDCQEVIAHKYGCTSYFLDDWINSDSDIREMYIASVYARAERWAHKCLEILANVQTVWTAKTTIDDGQGKVITKLEQREASTELNKAVHLCNRYWLWAATLNYEKFGQRAEEIKVLLDEIKRANEIMKLQISQQKDMALDRRRSL
jgi:hypothetical protein